MALRNGIPMKFKPRSYSDSWDGMNSPPGGMSLLQNLIPDPSTPSVFLCRPAATLLVDFSTGGVFSSPGFVSAAFELNGYIYGLVATSRNSGKDEPFCYNLSTGSFVTVSGVTSANVPVSPSATGDWVPPAATTMGPYVVITHPGFNGSNGYFGWFDVTTPSTPVWNSGNTTTNGLTNVPTSVALFFNRLYFSVLNTLQFTDTLTFKRTNASQQLTAGDASPITALSLFNLTTTTQGILQSLLVLKANSIFQVTGDASTNDLAINSFNTAAGTSAPRSVVPTPSGVFIVSSDGLRLVQPDGAVSEPDTDFRVPLLNAVYTSRISAGYNSDVYRICVQNGFKAGSPWEEYWYDLGRELWTGPHTFQQDIALPNKAGFVLFSHLNPGKMYASEVTQVSGSTFSELGSSLVWQFSTTPIGEDESVKINTVNVSTINMSFSSNSGDVTCMASDEVGGVLSIATVKAPSGVSALWGSFTWGSSIWFGQQYGLAPHQIPWTNPIVFTKLVFKATAVSSSGFKISNLRIIDQPADYITPYN